jgi:hypothetical protein
LETVFTVRSVPRLYNEDELPIRESLEAGVRIAGVCEMAASLLGVSLGAEERPPLEDVKKQRSEDRDCEG